MSVKAATYLGFGPSSISCTLKVGERKLFSGNSFASLNFQSTKVVCLKCISKERMIVDIG